MGQTQSIQSLCFRDMQCIANGTRGDTLLISTLPEAKQNCLISNTISCSIEQSKINDALKTKLNTEIVVYGENAQDESPMKKCEQLRSLGFYNVAIYRGGLFEWLLLQDIYGDDLFPATNEVLDHLQFGGISRYNTKLITN